MLMFSSTLLCGVYCLDSLVFVEWKENKTETIYLACGSIKFILAFLFFCPIKSIINTSTSWKLSGITLAFYAGGSEFKPGLQLRRLNLSIWLALAQRWFGDFKC